MPTYFGHGSCGLGRQTDAMTGAWEPDPVGRTPILRRAVSAVFGHRLRQAGLLGSMGRVASSVDNTMIESL